MNAHVVQPALPYQIRRLGVLEQDYKKLSDLAQRFNRTADRCVPFTLLSVVSCGMAGWCCLLYDGAAARSAAQKEIDTFNHKYKQRGIQVGPITGGLVFTKM